nr:hypothetical protein [Tanacetum cinerariifolium]
MSIDDLYNNFKIIEQEVKRIVTKSSSSGSQNIAFLSSLGSTNEIDSANIQVSTVSTPVGNVSTHDNTANLSDTAVYAFLANQLNRSQLVHEDLEQIHEGDLEEMGLKWQLALLSIRARRSLRNQESRLRNQNSSRKTMNVEDTYSKAMVAIDGAGFDWSYMADDEAPTNMALMAFSDLGLICTLTIDLSNSGLEEFQHPKFKGYGPKANGIKTCVGNVEKRTSQREVRPVWNNTLRINHQNFSNSKRNFAPTTVLTKSGIEPISTARKSSLRAATPVSDVRPINTIAPTTLVNVAKPRQNALQKSHSLSTRPFYQHRTLKNRNLNNRINTAKLNFVNTTKGNRVTSVVGKQGINGDPKDALKDQGYFDSGCSRHMIGNISYLTHFKEHDGGYVAFWAGAKGGKITGKGTIRIGKIDFEGVYFVKELQFNLFSVSQMCDKKNSVPFTETECFVLSPNFKLADESDVLLKVPRKNNMVLVVKPNFKTPYELFRGRSRALSIMRPFGFHVIILNTLDQLGKFDGKLDERIFVCYSTISKAFRVYNNRTRKVEENLHITFLENKPMVTDGGPEWLFDIDALSKSMNYAPVPAGTNSNDFAGKGASFDAVNTATPTYVDYHSYPLMPDLEDTRIFDDAYNDRDEGTKHEYNNLEIVILASPITSTRIHKDQPKEQIIGELHSADLVDESWVEAMQEELLQFKLLNVWTLVDLPHGKSAIGTKWVFRNKRDQRGIVVRNKSRLVAQVHRQEESINYDEVFAPVAKIEAISVKSASTPIEIHKPLSKDADGTDVDVHLDRSMIGSLMYLKSSRPDIMFVVCACSRFQVQPKVSHIHAVKRIYRYLKGQPTLGLWYPKDLLLELIAYYKRDYVGVSPDRKSTTRELKGYLINDGYADLVNMLKPQGSEAFHQIVDFLNASNIRTLDNVEIELNATVDCHNKTITSASVRRHL